MTIQDLEQQLLSLSEAERQRIAQLLIQSLTTQPTPIHPAAEKFTLTTAIADFRSAMSPEELDPSAEDIWQSVRDRTPAPTEPRW